MSIPKGLAEMPQRVVDMVREMMPRWRVRLTPEEERLAVHLRGNEALLKALKEMVAARIAGRANVPEPSDPLDCKSMLARDRELQWLLGKLEFVYRSPVNQPGRDSGERPA